MNKAYLLTGGNMGNREETLGRARVLIEQYAGSILRVSSFYETEAWGKTDQPAFLNQALEIKTVLKPHDLLRELLHIESICGRKREEKYGPRILDIDILLVGNTVVNDDSLVIPHPEMAKRRFALVPLTEIAPFLIHPVLGKTISQLLEECPDTLNVVKVG
jgi:2-amino-4-hydroxy-6-hydroxymethyldihydropteridine diphosphokinase